MTASVQFSVWQCVLTRLQHNECKRADGPGPAPGSENDHRLRLAQRPLPPLLPHSVSARNWLLSQEGLSAGKTQPCFLPVKVGILGNLTLAQYSLLSQAVASDCLSRVLTKKRNFVSGRWGEKLQKFTSGKVMLLKVVHNTNIGAL